MRPTELLCYVARLRLPVIGWPNTSAQLPCDLWVKTYGFPPETKPELATTETSWAWLIIS